MDLIEYDSNEKVKQFRYNRSTYTSNLDFKTHWNLCRELNNTKVNTAILANTKTKLLDTEDKKIHTNL